MFLSPTDALHGDLGILSESDLLILLSKSGCTEELIRLVPYAKVRTPSALPVQFLMKTTYLHSNPQDNGLRVCKLGVPSYTSALPEG